MNRLKKIPFFLILLALFFCLHGSVENYGYLYLGEVLFIGFIIVLSIGVLFSFIWLLLRDILFASLLTFFISLWYLFFGAVQDLIKSTSFLHFLKHYTVLLPILLIANVLFIWWLKQNKKLHVTLFLYLNVLFIIFCFADSLLLLYKHFSYNEATTAGQVNFIQTKVTQKPNVYFLLFDEYAGYKSLQDSFGFKNDSLYNFMRQQGFKNLSTFSNYDFTPYSMSSIFNMQYVPGTHNNQMLTQADVQQRFGEIRNGKVLEIFKTMGYAIENYSVFDFKNEPALAQTNGLFPIHATLLTNKIFHKRLLKDIGWWFVTGKFQISWLNKKVLYGADDYNKMVEEKVKQLALTKMVKPVFCYAHLFLPHSQYFRDSTGAFNSPEHISDLFNKSLYLSYLKYTNKVMQSIVSKISAADPGAMVIIMSDHGFYDYNSPGDSDPYNYDNICMVKMPAGKTGSDNLPFSNVNFFRYLFNAGFGQQFSYVKDSTVFVIEDHAVK
jgi:hypothetical protein